MKRALLISVLAFSACAASDRSLDPIEPPMHGELSLLYDGGDNHGADLGVVDLAGLDLPPGGCGVLQLKVNEVQTGGATATDEWVELFNPCPNPVALSGAKLAYRSATNSTATDDTILAQLSGMLASGGYYLAAGSGYTGSATPDAKWTSGGLKDTGGSVGLRDGSGTLADSVGWGSAFNTFVEKTAAPAPAAGHSIARSPDGHDTGDNSQDFAERSSPTPKAAN